MIIEKATVTDYRKVTDFRGYKVYINSYWVEIRDKDNVVVFKRTPDMDEWLDAAHRQITDAIDAFEKGLTEVLPHA